jgi:iron complex outermembrane receptor protein
MRALVRRARFTIIACSGWAAAAVFLGSLIAAAPVCAADSAAPVLFDIPAQPLETALLRFSEQAGVQVVVSNPAIKGLPAAALRGSYPIEKALQVLLQGSGLGYRFTSDRTIAISTAKSHPTSSMDTPSAVPSAATYRSDEEQASAPTGIQLEEIVVTAQKREERLQDVPVPVASINAATLVENNQLRLQDYYQSIPGLSITPSVQSTQTLAIRGITTGGGTNPTVGVTVDDVPFGSSTNLGGGLVVPDLDPGDLARVEVLRGPQGTLYGASSMGGLLKFVTLDPSTEGFSGRAQVGTVGVVNGNGLGYNVRGSVNAPVTDDLALRASAFTRDDPGYIDNPVLDAKGVNEAHVSGGRLAASWKPLDNFSAKLTALYQDTRGNGSNDVDRVPGLGDLQQNYIPDVGGYDRRIQAYSATLTARVGSADLISLSGYNSNAYSDSSDYTYAVGPLTNLLFGVQNSPLYNNNRTDKFTQEVRLSMPLGQAVDWLLGGFYTHESSSYSENVLAQDPATLASLGEVLGIDFPTRYTEYAGFTDFTLRFTEHLDVQLGGRESHIEQTFNQTEFGDAVGTTPLITPEERSSANAFTYLVTPRLKLSPDLMLYVRLASGYRAGGTNATIPGEPSQYNPDKTHNYDLGLKGDFLDRRLSLDASLFYIAWDDIQLQLHDPSGLGFNANGGKAKSEGVELSTQARPVTGLTIAAWVVWNEAVLTQDFPADSTVLGVSGDRLPDSSRISGYFAIDQRIPLGSALVADFGADESYVGDRISVFTATAARQRFAPYAKTDFHAGLNYNTWNAVLYANNVTDRRGILNGGLGGFPPYAFTYIQPRTIGLTLSKNF